MLTFQPLMRLDPRRKCLIEVKVRSEIFYHVALYLSTPRITPPPTHSKQDKRPHYVVGPMFTFI